MAKKTRKSKKQPPAFAVRPPEITILSDGALDPKEWEKAGFDLQQTLGSVYDLIRHPSTQLPMTIAIYGDWGTGKSSAMKWLDGLLDTWRADGPSDKVVVQTVWFEPWKYHTRDDVWRGLIAEVLLKSIDVQNLKLDDAAKKLVTAAGKFGGWLGRSFLEGLKAIKLKASIAGGVAGGELAVGEALDNVIEDLKRTTHPERAYLNEFEQTFAQCLRDWLPGNQRMVVFIDDLDRCLPDVALEVMEALKLYLSIDRLIFVVGLDRDVLDQIVLHHYEKQGVESEKAKDYLDKMFQVEVSIAPSQKQMGDFYAQQIDAIDALTRGEGQEEGGYWSDMLDGAGDGGYREILETTLRKLAGQNPRRVKRLLNGALALGYGATQLPGEDDLKPLRFAQGVQVFLILKTFESFYKGQRFLVRDDEGGMFFEAFSEAVCSGENVVPPAPEEDPVDRRPPEEGAAGVPKAEQPGPVSSFCQRAAGIYGVKLIRDLVNDPTLKELMRVPFSGDVAALSAAVQVERTPVPRLPGLPNVILHAVARQLGTPADSLTDDDLGRIDVLDLSGTEIGDAECQHLAKLTQLEKLILSRTGVGDVGCGELSKLSQLTWLDLEATGVGDAGCGELSKLSQLEVLDLEATGVGDAGCGELSKLSQLTRLDLEATGVGDAGCGELSKLSQLEVLDLDSTGVGDAGCGELSKLSRLRTLYLSNTGVGDVGCGELSKLSQLGVLFLSGTGVGDAGCGELSKLSQLTWLILLGTDIGDAGCAELTKLSQLQRLYLSNTGVGDVGCEELSKLSQLTWLDLEGTDVGDAGCGELSKLSQLKTLDLSGTGVRDAGCEHLIAAAAGGKLSAMEELSLPAQVTDEMRHRLAAALPECSIRYR